MQNGPRRSGVIRGECFCGRRLAPRRSAPCTGLVARHPLQALHGNQGSAYHSDDTGKPLLFPLLAGVPGSPIISSKTCAVHQRFLTITCACCLAFCGRLVSPALTVCLNMLLTQHRYYKRLRSVLAYFATASHCDTYVKTEAQHQRLG